MIVYTLARTVSVARLSMYPRSLSGSTHKRFVLLLTNRSSIPPLPTYFSRGTHAPVAYRLCFHLAFRWRPCRARQEKTCCSRQQGWRGGGGRVDDFTSTSPPCPQARPTGDWNPGYGAPECYAWKTVCKIIGKTMPLCCFMRQTRNPVTFWAILRLTPTIHVI